MCPLSPHPLGPSLPVSTENGRSAAPAMPGGVATLAGLAAFAKPLPVPPIDPSTRKKRTVRSAPPQCQIPINMPGGAREAAREYARERSRERERDSARHAHRTAVLAPLRNGYVRPPPALKSQANAIAAAVMRLDAAATFIQALARGRRGRQLTKEERAKVVARAEALHACAVACSSAMTAHAAAAPPGADPSTSGGGDGAGTIAAPIAAHWIDSERTHAAWDAANARAVVAARAPVSGVAGWTVDLPTSGGPISAVLVWTNVQWPTQGQAPS